MSPEVYCRFYSIPEIFIPVLKKLKPLDWGPFARLNHEPIEGNLPVAYQGCNRIAKIRTGFYSGSGAYAKAIRLTPVISAVLTTCDVKHNCKNDSPRKGAKHDYIVIYW